MTGTVLALLGLALLDEIMRRTTWIKPNGALHAALLGLHALLRGVPGVGRWLEIAADARPPSLSDAPTKPGFRPKLAILAALAIGQVACAGPIEQARKFDDGLALSARGCYKTVTAGRQAATARVRQLTADGKAAQAVKDGETYVGRLAMFEAGCKRGDDAAFKYDDQITQAEQRGDKDAARVLIPLLTGLAFDLADNIAKAQAFIAEVSHDGK